VAYTGVQDDEVGPTEFFGESVHGHGTLGGIAQVSRNPVIGFGRALSASRASERLPTKALVVLQQP
jgi:hypothetical protein